MAEPVDWPALMRLGLGLLRLPPDAFWSMTPGELRRALEGAGVIAADGRAMDRDRLAELMAAFPDAMAAAGDRRAAGAAASGAGAARAGYAEGERDEHG